MCLAIPAKIESMSDGRGTVELGGNRTNVILTLVPDAQVGDWVLIHAGFAITTLDEKEALETYDLLKQVAELSEPQPGRTD